MIPLLACLVILLILVPADFWHHPRNDVVYAGFDRTLTYVSPSSAARISGETLTISASPLSESSANLLTTPLSKFNISLDVQIRDNQANGVPLRIGIWTPWTGRGYFLTFGPAPENLIVSDYLTGGQPGRTLQGGRNVRTRELGAYAVGRQLGGPRLAPRWSPRKTWAGLIGGTGCAALAGWATARLLGTSSVLPLVLVSAGLAIVGQFGDLAESVAKRRFGVKDSSGLIPGHGGLLDRLDGLLAVVPAVALLTLIGGGSVLTWR